MDVRRLLSTLGIIDVRVVALTPGLRDLLARGAPGRGASTFICLVATG
jgi:hypothetical protein